MLDNTKSWTPRAAMATESLARRSAPARLARAAFTLVELLVVIVIISILASLITVAATAALDKAHQTRIKVELDQIDMAFRQYKNQYGAHPPSFDVVGNIDVVSAYIRRHIKKAFPRSKDTGIGSAL